MGILKLAEVKPGMEVAEPVMNRNGKVLLNAGVVITDRLREALETYGVTEVYIRFGDLEMDESNSTVAEEKSESQISHQLDYLFQKTDRNDPVIAQLYELALTVRLEGNN